MKSIEYTRRIQRKLLVSFMHIYLKICLLVKGDLTVKKQPLLLINKSQFLLMVIFNFQRLLFLFYKNKTKYLLDKASVRIQKVYSSAQPMSGRKRVIVFLLSCHCPMQQCYLQDDFIQIPIIFTYFCYIPPGF